MVAFLASSDLSRGDLRLFLRNDEGYAQDAFRVGWTVFTSTGIQVSGKSLQAVKAAVGEYYAPWRAKAVNGNYYIEWDVQADSSDCGSEKIREKFFVVQPSAYQCCPGVVCDNGQPAPGGFAYLVGSQLGRGDLPLFLKNADGFPMNAFAVFWTIFGPSGCPVTQKTAATLATTGEYFANWFVNVSNQGEFTIRWEFVESDGSPTESMSMGFTIINPGFLMCPNFSSCFAPASMSSSCSSGGQQSSGPCSCSGGGGGAPVPCGPQFPCTSVPPQVPVVKDSCCPFEIARVVHVDNQVLPIGGGFTWQGPYQIPARVRTIMFYVSYTRGAAGGFPILRLLWGNGVEETQSTLVDTDFTSSDPFSQQGMFLEDLKGPVPQTNDKVSFSIETSVPGGATTVRLLAAEGGVVGAPGSISITLTAAS
jgi:hypothetical protein